MRDAYDAALERARSHALDYLASLADRPVARAYGSSSVTVDDVLPQDPVDPSTVIDELAAAVEPGIVANGGGRYFGFVTGGTLPAAMAADWLTSAWDQNTALHVMSPAAISVQEVATAWLLELLDLPRDASVGVVTGAQMANWTCLAAARHRVLADVGWDVESDGLRGAPAVTVVVGDQRHTTIDRALRFLGFGSGRTTIVESDGQGRMRAEALAGTLDSVDGPMIVCAQAGEVNTGAFDPFGTIVDTVHDRGGWVHVDGAFGLWARACADRSHLAAGLDGADSWSVDGHKWLNLPYDYAFAITGDPAAHGAAMTQLAPYLVASDDVRHDPLNWSPEASRRARGFAVYAAIRSLGRSGIDDMISRHCRLARRFAERLSSADGVELLNDVALNQVLVRFTDADTRSVIDHVQRDGTCWVGGTTFKGVSAMRISVSGWATTEGDVDRSADAILPGAATARSLVSGGRPPAP